MASLYPNPDGSQSGASTDLNRPLQTSSSTISGPRSRTPDHLPKCNARELLRWFAAQDPADELDPADAEINAEDPGRCHFRKKDDKSFPSLRNRDSGEFILDFLLNDKPYSPNEKETRQHTVSILVDASEHVVPEDKPRRKAFWGQFRH
jgi:hypothetical protein